MAEYVRASTYANDPVTGYRDGSDNNVPALRGASNNRPGVALYRQGTLGGWYRVTAPNGRTAVVQHTDIGPSPSTGAQLDVNAVAARTLFGYKQGNAFPTKQGQWKIQYLGKRKPADAGVAPAAVKAAAVAPKAAAAAPNRDLLVSYLQQRGNPSALLSLGLASK